jgi:mRNA interferase RelE/StbE
MPHAVVYHPAVLDADLPAINRKPGSGEPLHFRLKGYWKLRVGDYRIVYGVPVQRLLWRP